jgi:DMSO/TMAO reductase YedYZ molybdopterin-dependent catalytic subunit
MAYPADEFNVSYIRRREEQAKKKLIKSSGVQGQDRLPPGQRSVDKMIAMPPITASYPHIEKSDWKLKVYGEVGNEKEWSWEEFLALPQKKFKIDFHCVTTWSKLDQEFLGVDFEDILKETRPKDSAKFVIFESFDGYSTNISLDELKRNIAFIAIKMDNKEIEVEFGGPARLVVPHLYAYKSAKFLKAIRFQQKDEPGFWESRGYHNHADPWKEER